MKQNHIFFVSIMHDENENRISTKVIQGPIKREFETDYVVDNNGNDEWISKEFLREFKVVKEDYIPEGSVRPIVDYNMGFIWEDGTPKYLVQYMADECQRRCKLPVIDHLNELRKEIDESIDKLIESKTCVVI